MRRLPVDSQLTAWRVPVETDWDWWIVMAPSEPSETAKCGNVLGAGPPVGLPLLSNLLPWQLQYMPSATMEPRERMSQKACVQSVLMA